MVLINILVSSNSELIYNLIFYMKSITLFVQSWVTQQMTWFLK